MRHGLALCLVFGLVSISAVSHAATAPYRAAVLDEPSLPVDGVATPVSTFERVFAEEGVPLTRLSASQLADARFFNADAFDLLVIPTGASFPVAAKDSLLAFLQHGGDLLCAGGYAFDSLWVRSGGQWVRYADQLRAEKAKARDVQSALIPNGGFESGREGWASSGGAACEVVNEAGCSGRTCGRVVSHVANDGGCWEKALDVKPGQSYLIGARMKTGAVTGTGFAYFAVYQFDAHGKLVTFVDFTHVRKATDWTRYETQVDIAASSTRVVFRAGFYRAAGTQWVDDVTCAPLPHEERINAHYGKPEDGLVLDPLQLTIYSPDQPFAGATLVPATGYFLPKGWRSAGAVRGYEATAQLEQQARWRPLIEARDQWDRPSGVAGAMVSHYAGPFVNSSWVIFGAVNRDVFAGPSGAALLKAAVRRLRAAAFVQSVTTDSALYSRGATAHITVTVRNPSRYPRSVRVDLATGPAKGKLTFAGVQSTDLPAGGSKTLRLTKAIPDDATDFQRIEVSLRVGGTTVDRLDTGVCVRDDRVLASGTRIAFANNAYTLSPGAGVAPRACLFGTDTWGNMFSSPSDSPWTWYQDLRTMRDNGLDLFENLQFAPTNDVYSAAQQNQLDALIQLSQQFGLPYMAGLLIGHDVVVENAELAREAKFCRRFAARYRNAPGLIYYLNGDFALHLKDIPDIHRLWNDFLRRRYGDDADLREAWRQTPPKASLGNIAVKDAPAQSWYDPRTRDTTAFKVELMKRWIGALTAAIRQEDRTHPITAEYYQAPHNGVDLRLTSNDLTAGNFGYFDAPLRDIAQLMAVIKWNDLQRSGRGVNIGEFGVKTHDAWSVARGAEGYHIERTDAQRDQLFWWMAHAALAMGVSKIQNWCWSDAPDRVFPWGLAWNNPLRPKPVLKLYRNLRLLGDRIAFSYHPADVVMVMPDNWRMGAPDTLSHTTLLNAIECLLATNVPFDVVNENDLDRLPAARLRLVVMPCAYALPDDAITRLRRLVESGVWLYLSGDPSIDPAGVRRPERLDRLFGVRFQRETTLASGMPVPIVTPLEAKPLSNSTGLTVYEHRIGQGHVIWAPSPWETFPGHDLFVEDPGLTQDPTKNFYLSLVSMAGAKSGFELKSEGGPWWAMVRASGADHLVTVFPRSISGTPGSAQVTAFGATLGFNARLEVPALALLNPQGQVLLATGSGALDVNGRRWAEGSGAWSVCSLTDRDLTSATELMVNATEDGNVWWRSSVGSLTAWLVEFQNGELRVVAPITTHRKGDGWQVSVLRNELYVVTRVGQPPTSRTLALD